jgi:hypothetical protein
MAQKVSNSLGKLGDLPMVVTAVIALSACSPPTPSPTSSSTASTATSPEICAGFNSTIDNNIFEIAMSEIEGEILDKSAVQQSARLAQNNNRLSTIMVNIQMQAQNQCPARQKPIDASIYTSQALNCYRAKLGHASTYYGADENAKTAEEAKVTLACDFKAWNTPAAK